MPFKIDNLYFKGYAQNISKTETYFEYYDLAFDYNVSVVCNVTMDRKTPSAISLSLPVSLSLLFLFLWPINPGVPGGKVINLAGPPV